MKLNSIIKKNLVLFSSATLFTITAFAKDANILVYEDRGITYYPKYVEKGLIRIGKASWYGKPFHGRFTANGERYDMYNMTAAHRTYAMNTILRVTNLANKKSVKVRVNDRGPFYLSRNIDLSYGAAKKLGIAQQGIGKVKIEVLNHPTKKWIPEPVITTATTTTKSFNRDQMVQIASFSNSKSAQEFKMKHQYKNIAVVPRYNKVNKKTSYKVVINCTPWEAKHLIDSKKFSGAFLLS